jgi:uncharacterized protein with GYD domain
MPKFLVQFSYTAQGVQGLLKDGGSKRRDVAAALAESLGAKLEAYYYTFGDTDGFGIIDGPDNVTAAAASLIISSTGAVATKTIVLLTPEEIDAACQKSGKYSPPGQ